MHLLCLQGLDMLHYCNSLDLEPLLLTVWIVCIKSHLKILSQTKKGRESKNRGKLFLIQGWCSTSVEMNAQERTVVPF